MVRKYIAWVESVEGKEWLADEENAKMAQKLAKASVKAASADGSLSAAAAAGAVLASEALRFVQRHPDGI